MQIYKLNKDRNRSFRLPCSEPELEAFHRLAATKDFPLTILMRTLLKEECDKHGIVIN